MTEENIITLASSLDMLDADHCGPQWVERLTQFAQQIAEYERAQYEKELSILRNELERVHELYLVFDRKAFDGSQK